MGQPMRFRLRVRHYEVDEYGHVNHANYVHYLEAARIEALEAVGLPLGEMRRQGYIIVAADLAVKYHSPARSGEMLEIVTHIRDVRGARSVWVQEVREAASQRLVVTAEVTGAFMTESGRPVRTPDTMREKLSALFVPGSAGRGSTTAGPPHGVNRGSRSPGRAVDEPGPHGPLPKPRSWCVCRGGGVRAALRQIGGIGR